MWQSVQRLCMWWRARRKPHTTVVTIQGPDPVTLKADSAEIKRELADLLSMDVGVVTTILRDQEYILTTDVSPPTAFVQALCTKQLRFVVAVPDQDAAH